MKGVTAVWVLADYLIDFTVSCSVVVLADLVLILFLNWRSDVEFVEVELGNKFHEDIWVLIFLAAVCHLRDHLFFFWFTLFYYLDFQIIRFLGLYVVKLGPVSCVGVSWVYSPVFCVVLEKKAFVVQVDDAIACHTRRSSHNFIIHEYLCCIDAFGLNFGQFFVIRYWINRGCSKNGLFRKELGVQFEMYVH